MIPPESGHSVENEGVLCIDMTILKLSQKLLPRLYPLDRDVLDLQGESSAKFVKWIN